MKTKTAAVNPDALRRAVSKQLGVPVQIESYQTTSLQGGTLGDVQLLSGDAQTANGCIQAFRIVLKTQKHWERPGDPGSWRREYDLFESAFHTLSKRISVARKSISRRKTETRIGCGWPISKAYPALISRLTTSRWPPSARPFSNALPCAHRHAEPNLLSLRRNIYAAGFCPVDTGHHGIQIPSIRCLRFPAPSANADPYPNRKRRNIRSHQPACRRCFATGITGRKTSLFKTDALPPSIGTAWAGASLARISQA